MPLLLYRLGSFSYRCRRLVCRLGGRPRAVRGRRRHLVRTAAAVIAISVFASFLGSADATTKSMGFAFAFGNFVDAFLGRTTLVPAVLAVVGDHAWRLPCWLDRLVPHVDVAGSRLTRPACCAPGDASD